jgi:hypothetical protein
MRRANKTVGVISNSISEYLAGATNWTVAGEMHKITPNREKTIPFFNAVRTLTVFEDLTRRQTR